MATDELSCSVGSYHQRNSARAIAASSDLHRTSDPPVCRDHQRRSFAGGRGVSRDVGEFYREECESRAGVTIVFYRNLHYHVSDLRRVNSRHSDPIRATPTEVLGRANNTLPSCLARWSHADVMLLTASRVRKLTDIQQVHMRRHGGGSAFENATCTAPAHGCLPSN
jgi:hypothetical protein